MMTFSFSEKICCKGDLVGDETLIIPEYKIKLLNKSKKVINKIENINFIEETKFKNKKRFKSSEKKETKKVKKDSKKIKRKKILRTLWVRRKKKSN